MMTDKNSFNYKISIRVRYVIAFLNVFMLIRFESLSQDTALNKFGLFVIETESLYKKSISSQPDKMMVDIRTSLPGIQFDLRYAGKNNFMHKKFYSISNNSFLRLRAVIALAAVQRELNNKKMGLLIWDAYRPYHVTEEMWYRVKDEKYAASPAKGSGHNRGIAVDLTIIDTISNRQLQMGTDFDNFSDTANHNFKSLPRSVLQNRILLKTTMEKFGFKSLDSEWWHYYLPEAQNYELLDLSFKELNRLTKQK